MSPTSLTINSFLCWQIIGTELKIALFWTDGFIICLIYVFCCESCFFLLLIFQTTPNVSAVYYFEALIRNKRKLPPMFGASVWFLSMELQLQATFTICSQDHRLFNHLNTDLKKENKKKKHPDGTGRVWLWVWHRWFQGSFFWVVSINSGFNVCSANASSQLFMELQRYEGNLVGGWQIERKKKKTIPYIRSVKCQRKMWRRRRQQPPSRDADRKENCNAVDGHPGRPYAALNEEAGKQTRTSHPLRVAALGPPASGPPAPLYHL